MGSLKALQEWCRAQCEHHGEVDVKDMSASFRDGLAFCAIIHRYRPELIDFGSLSKENVYENNRLAFDVAETQLGIPALLDPEDMVSMKVPDRLSIITYVSQYYNFFNKSQANPPCMKRLSSVDRIEPAPKRPSTPLEDKASESEPSQTSAQTDGEADAAAVKRSKLSSTCAACQKHVHLVQRFLVDGKLYHRSCFRCTECHSTLLPGSYKLGTSSGALVCTHHLARHALANQNGRPDISKKPVVGQSARIGRSTIPHTSPSERDRAKTPPPPPASQTHETDTPTNDSAPITAVTTHAADSLEKAKVMDGGGEEEATPRSSSPPNPFDESDDEEVEREEDAKTPAKLTINGDLPSTPLRHNDVAGRPVPAPRRVAEPTPPPRPAPRVRLPRAADGLPVGEHQKPPIPPKPRERSRSPGSLSSGAHKPKDPPWLALVQSDPKKKKAPPRPPAGLATRPNTGSLSSLKAGGSKPSTPPAPANPFDDDDEDDNGEVAEEEGGGESAIPPTVVASHPWYSITQAADATGADAPPSGGSSSRSESPGSASKKRPAPRAPQPPPGRHVLSHSQPSSCSPSPALSTESLSPGSSHPHLAGGDKEQHAFTKSVSEPSICSPCDSAPSPSSSSAERLPHPSLSPAPSPMPSSASSAPATPQPSRSFGTKGTLDPPPRPSTTPSPLASQTHNKRTCKENPFNRKASPSPAKSKTKPPTGPRPARPPAPGHGFPLIKRKVQSDQYIPVEDIHVEMGQLQKQLDELEQKGVQLEKKLRDNPNDEDEEHLLVDWFTLIHEKHLLVRREAELVYTAKQQNLEERQTDVEYELRCLLNKPEKDWTAEDKSRDQQLMAELVTIIEQRNQIVNNMDQDRQREEEEDKLMEAMLKKKDFHKDPEVDQQRKKKKKGAKFKPIKVLKRLSHRGEPGKSHSPRKEKSP
ncbi:MICAL-like protein 1 isoform X1 [Pseudoliparis swirei]|uniref:MICAL-like protein 1 isoform X1 n=2 Tax=Pseudoliparis swirei TaxID=2059687 RepID=UPI0024BE55F2|nr:MICAL-like protein 1 isoform X1 [Pseudoliparis swirei]XP_056266407.1 MICAL-like protein 1 isoform X1 [Pseudoliparis swirei]